MTWRRALPWLLLFALVMTGGARGWPGTDDDEDRGDRPSPGTARVVDVVDGDTVKVRTRHGRDTVRYIGVDTPETHRPGTPVQCFGRAATRRNVALVLGERVRLRTDREERDRYGRLLAYVFRTRDGLHVNAELVRQGFATTLTIRPNVAHAPLFRRLEVAARAARRGLWGACPAP